MVFGVDDDMLQTGVSVHLRQSHVNNRLKKMGLGHHLSVQIGEASSGVFLPVELRYRLFSCLVLSQV